MMAVVLTAGARSSRDRARMLCIARIAAVGRIEMTPSTAGRERGITMTAMVLIFGPKVQSETRRSVAVMSSSHSTTPLQSPTNPPLQTDAEVACCWSVVMQDTGALFDLLQSFDHGTVTPVWIQVPYGVEVMEGS